LEKEKLHRNNIKKPAFSKMGHEVNNAQSYKMPEFFFTGIASQDLYL
jgi:hypothetical protein